MYAAYHLKVDKLTTDTEKLQNSIREFEEGNFIVKTMAELGVFLSAIKGAR